MRIASVGMTTVATRRGTKHSDSASEGGGGCHLSLSIHLERKATHFVLEKEGGDGGMGVVLGGKGDSGRKRPLEMRASTCANASAPVMTLWKCRVR